MANIKINNIKFDGSELFADDEGFMDQLVDSELNNIKGGLDLAVARPELMITDTWVASCACPNKFAAIAAE